VTGAEFSLANTIKLGGGEMTLPEHAFDGMVDGHYVNGVWIHPLLAFSHIDDWYSDFINRALPEMGEKYMLLFIDAGFSPAKWMKLVEKEPQP